jgi:PiT family inorganic phosphate transporter
MYTIAGGILLGWALGANDGAIVFGTAVASRIVRYRTAVILAAIFIITGAVIQGGGGIRTLGGLTEQDKHSAFLVTVAAATTVIFMTRLRLPVSSSQATVGAIIGMGLTRGFGGVAWGGLAKVVTCWIGTPIGAALIAFILYPVLARCLDKLRLNIIGRSRLLKGALIVGGCCGAYAMGGNSAANVAGVFYRAGVLDDNIRLLALIGGASMALGVLTYSKGVMMTVGSGLVSLDAFSALVALAAMATTVYVYALVGVPVSTSQAIVGGVLGIGLWKGVRTVNGRMLLRILSGWIATPLIAGVITFTVGMIIF